MTAECKNPGELMPRLILEIGENMAKIVKKEKEAEKRAEKIAEKEDIWKVTHETTVTIRAKNEKEAVEIARELRQQGYGGIRTETKYKTEKLDTENS